MSEDVPVLRKERVGLVEAVREGLRLDRCDLHSDVEKPLRPVAASRRLALTRGAPS